jgi:hypothetical protein
LPKIVILRGKNYLIVLGRYIYSLSVSNTYDHIGAVDKG